MLAAQTNIHPINKLGRITIFVLALLVGTLYSLVVFSDKVSAFAGGAGTSGDPYQITTAAELASVSSYLGAGNSGKYFKVMNNIDLNVSPYNTGTGWTPIGTSSNYFYGRFDGNYKTISGLYFNNAAASGVGLFGAIGNTGQVQNVLLSVPVVTGNVGVGALAGTNYGTITRAGVSGGSVTATQRVGGLVGSNQGTLSYAFSNLSVYFNPTSSPTCCAGGLAGEVAWGGSANNSYSRSTVTMTYNIYNQGSVGGILGNDYSSNAKSNFYSTGAITMVSGSFPSNTGGLSGGTYTTISGSYWDTQTSGWATSLGGAGVVGKTTAQMKTQSTYSGWDFSTIWAIDGTGVINNGYPYLQWETSLSSNVSPNVPSSLGPTGVVNGSAASVTQPTLSFNLSDSNASDTLKYQVQIDDNSDFSSPVVDYTSALAAQGAASFTVGQAAGGGTYSTGSSGQALTDGSYYWRVKAIDNSAAASAYTTANSGSIAFKVDTVAPTVPGTPSVTTSANDNTPSWSWAVSTDGGSGMNSYVIQWSSSSNFSSYSNTSTGPNNYTLPLSLSDGTWYFRVAGRDSAQNVSAYSASGSVTIDTISPVLSSVSPANSATAVSINSSLNISFDEAVDVSTGNIIIRRVSDDSEFITIPANSAQVSGGGSSTLVITPSSSFEYGTSYYVIVNSDAITDLVGNAYAGISNSLLWSFKAAEKPVAPTNTSTSLSSSIKTLPAPVESIEPVIADQSTGKIELDAFPEYFAGLGKQLNLTLGQVVYFTVNHNGVLENHTATVKELGDNYVILTIASTPFDIKIQVGELKKISIEGAEAMHINLLGVTEGLADLKFIKPTIPESSPQMATNISDVNGEKRSNIGTVYALGILSAALVTYVVIIIRKRSKNQNGIL